MADISNEHKLKVGVGYDVQSDQLAKMTSDTETVNSALLKLATSLSGLEKQMGSLTNATKQQSTGTKQAQQTAESYIQTLKNEVNAGVTPLADAYKKLYAARKRTLDKAESNQAMIQDLELQRKSISKSSEEYATLGLQISAAKDKQKEYTAIIANQNTTLNSWIKILGTANSTIDTTLNNMQSFANSIKTQYSAGVITAQEATKQLQQEISRLQTALGKNSDNNSNIRLTQQLSEAQRVLQQFATIGSNSTKNLMNEVKANLKTIDSAYQELLKRQSELQDKLSKTSISDKLYQTYVKDLANVNKQIDTIERNAYQSKLKYENAKAAEAKKTAQAEVQAQREKVNELNTLWQTELKNFQSIEAQKNATSTLRDFSGDNSTLKHSIFNAGLQLTGVRMLANEFQNLGNEIVEVDYKLINTQRIMGDFSSSTADYLLANATEMAKQTDIQITDAQDIQSAWVRINDAYAQNKELLSEISMMTSKFMNVGEIEDAEQAVALLNASLLQFNVTASQSAQKAEEFSNKWAYMADITAMGTADEYGEAISKFGAQIDALRGNMDDAIALSSVMADKLAKDGAEAGNSLKTITTYLNRDKTVNLFNDIADDLGDMNYQLVDANGRFKDFDSTLRTVAQAYEIYKNAGNDVMAQDILNALGATRQRDAALAVINSLNDGSYDSYLEKLNSDAVDGYLDKQNDALMETFKAQWNELKVSIEEFGNALARSGILDGLNVLMNGFSSLLGVISKIPQPVLTTVNAIAGLKAAKMAAGYIGNLTGATQAYNSLINQGTKSEVEQANAINQAANAYKIRQEAYIDEQLKKAQLNQLSEQELQETSKLISSYGEQRTMLSELETAYNNGIINASEYTQGVRNIVTVEEQQKNAVRMTRDELIEKINAQTQETTSQNAETSATQTNTVVENNNSQAKQRGILATLSKIKATFSDTLQIKKNNNATVAATISNKLMNSSVMGLISSETVHNAIGSATQTVLTGIGTAAAYASAGISALMAALSPILALVSVVTTVWSLGQMIFGLGTDANNASEELDNLKQELDEVNQRVEELKNLSKQSGLSGTEQQELDYLQKRKDILEQTIKLKEQEQNNDKFLNHQGGFLGIGGTDSKKEELDDLINKYNKLTHNVKLYSETLEQSALSEDQAKSYAKMLSDANDHLRSSAADLVEEYYSLKEAIDNGSYTDDALNSAQSYLGKLEELLPQAEALVSTHQNLSDTIRAVSDDTEEYANNISALKDTVSTLNDLFDEYNKEGYLSYETVSKLVSEHPEYVKYLVKVGDQYKLNKVAENDLNETNKDIIETTDEMIAKLDEQAKTGQLVTDAMTEAVDAIDYYTVGIRDTFKDVEGVDAFVDGLREINTSLLKGESSIDDYNAAMNDLINNTDFSKVSQSIDGVNEQTKTLIQSQQAMFSTLAQEVGSYISEITNALYDGQMSVSDYVNALQGSNQNLLDLMVASNNLTQNQDGQWVDATNAVNDYANALQNSIDLLNGMGSVADYVTSCFDQMSLAAENNANVYSNTAQANASNAWWASEEGMNAANAMRDNFLVTMSDLANNNAAAYNDIVNQTATATGLTRDQVITMLQDNTINSQESAQVVGAGTTAMMNMVGNAAQQATSSAGDVFTSLGNMISSFQYEIKATPYISGGFSIKKDEHGIPSGINLPTFGFNITGSGGDSVNRFASSLNNFGSSLHNLAISDYLSDIKAYNPSRGNFSTGGVASNYNPTSSGSNGSSADRNTPATRTPSTTKSSSKKSDAEKAAEKAAKAIEQLTEQYVKNVESMQDRIAKALKKKYQEQYDERKKLLEKEHNDRVSQIQAEIDAINGNRHEDKQSELSRLKKQLERWQADDSTLGKAKQKEYLDKIKDLEKEIKLDELEDKLDKENENYENSIDSDSAFYDAILKKLDDQMSDEKLYREANDLLRNEKTQEIIDLLTKYDSQWNGWATLMGKTAGEIIADEVRLAIANMKDVINGTITENGGKYTTGASGSTSSGSSSSGSSSSGTRYHTVQSGDTLWDLAQKYYGDPYQWTKIQNANGGINPKALPIGKQLVIPFATGGYTGEQEGLAYLHKKERVLTSQQTSMFDHLVYDFLPTISKTLLTPTNSATYNNGGNVTFNKPLAEVKIDKVINNKQFDVDNGVDNVGRMIERSLKKSGINLGKK